MGNRFSNRLSLPVAPRSRYRESLSCKPFVLISFAVPLSLNPSFSHPCKNSRGGERMPSGYHPHASPFPRLPLTLCELTPITATLTEKHRGYRVARRFPIRESCSRPAVVGFPSRPGGLLVRKGRPPYNGDAMAAPSRCFRAHAAVGMHTQEFIQRKSQFIREGIMTTVSAGSSREGCLR